MSIKAEHKELIETAIKRCPHYKGNEEFLNIFCEEVYERVQNTLQILGDNLPPQTYLDKVTQKSILHVLKNRQRLGHRFDSDELPIENLISFNINEKSEIVFNIPYPNSDREKISVIHEQLRVIIDNLHRLNENEPEKQYLRFFELKYHQNLKIPDIAYKMNMTEAQASQRFFELLAKLSDF